jgi:hypothetical protein
MAIKPKKKDSINNIMKGPKRGAGDPNYIKKMLESAPKKPTPKATAKATVKAKPKPTKTPLSKSEKDFLAGQKYKAKITKKTGVYPNTAN